METKLEKKTTRYLETVFCGEVTHEENTEMIVTDQSPDIARIICGEGSAYIKDKNARDGKADITGTVKGSVLYMAEGESEARRLPVVMPFAYVIDGEKISADSKMQARAYLRSFEAREQNPRKVAVRAEVCIEVCVQKEAERTVTVAAENAEELGLCVHMRKIETCEPCAVKEKNFVVSDDAELPQSAENMSEILLQSVNFVTGDTKMIGNKIILKGTAEVSYVFADEGGKLMSGEHELPFSQIVDFDDIEESNMIKACINPRGIELEPQYDASGKARYITVTASAESCVTVCRREITEVMDDIYSTRCEIKESGEKQSIDAFCSRSEKRVNVNESVNAKAGVKEILSTSVTLLPAMCKKGEDGESLVSEAVICALYAAEDGEIYSACRRAEVICPVRILPGHRCSASVTARGKTVSAGAKGEINVRFFADFDITETEKTEIRTIDSVTVDTESTAGYENKPSISVMRLSDDTDIWALAKACRTTEEAIRLANRMPDGETLVGGRMVIVPKGR